MKRIQWAAVFVVLALLGQFTTYAQQAELDFDQLEVITPDNADQLALLSTFQATDDSEGVSFSRVSSKLSPSGGLLLADVEAFLEDSSYKGVIQVWSLATQTLVDQVEGMNQDFSALEIDPTDRYVAYGDGTDVILRDIAEHREVNRWSIGQNFASARFSPAGSLIAVPQGEQIMLWSLTSQAEVGRLSLSSWQYVFSPDGNQLAGVSPANTLQVWDLWSDAAQTSFTPTLAFEVSDVGDVAAIAFTRDGEDVVFPMGSDSLVVWRLRDNTMDDSLLLYDDTFPLNYLLLAKGVGDIFIAPGMDAPLLYDVALETAYSEVSGIALEFNKAKTLFLKVTTEGEAQLLTLSDVQSGTDYAPLGSTAQSDANPIYFAGFGAEGKVIVIATLRGEIQILGIP